MAPKDPAAHRAMGRLYMEAGGLDKALAAFDAGWHASRSSFR